MSTTKNVKQPSLFTAIAFGVSCMVGSGWLFAAYYTARDTGSYAFISWVIGAVLALMLALLLAEITTMYRLRGLFSRLITISHNRDIGFVFALSNWLGLVIVIPSEAVATIQYLASSVQSWEPHLFSNHNLTLLGTTFVCLLMVFYGAINYWGIKSLAKFNNLVTVIKIIVPSITVLILLITSFHPGNFSVQEIGGNQFGLKTAFAAVVSGGIFYAFYGYSMIVNFASELKNPKRNIPLALFISITLVTAIYLLLEFAFMGAVPPALLTSGWHNLNFTSPLAQLLLLLNLNFWAIILYADAAISPSGTATVYAGSAERMFTGMAHDQQMPSFFDRIHPIYKLSRRSLLFSILISLLIVILFKNWQQIVILVTTFQLLTCLAIPIAFVKLRYNQAHKERSFRMPLGKTISFLMYLMVTFLLVQVEFIALSLALILHIVLFVVYTCSYYRGSIRQIYLAIKSSWSIFVYLGFVTLFGYFQDIGKFFNPCIFAAFTLISFVLYWGLLSQGTSQVSNMKSESISE